MSDLWWDLAQELAPGILAGRLDSSAARVVEALQAGPETPYHIVVSLAFTNDPAEIADSLDQFLEAESKRFDIGAVYTESNGFFINPGRWYYDWFAYKGYGGLEDPDWIAYWDSDRHPEVTLTGMEALQKVYAAHQGSTDDEGLERAADLCSLLVVLRFQQLMQRSLPLSSRLAVPVLATAHDFDLFYEYRPPGAPTPAPLPATDGAPPTAKLEDGADWYHLTTGRPPREARSLGHLMAEDGTISWTLGDQLTAGHLLDATPETLQVAVLTPGAPMSWERTGIGSVVVVSESVAEALRDTAGDDVQIIPAAVQGEEGSRFVVNITRLVDCLDVNASHARTHREVYGRDSANPPEDIASLDRLVIDVARVPAEAAIFRIARLQMHVVVSRRVAQALAAAEVSGVEFGALA